MAALRISVSKKKEKKEQINLWWDAESHKKLVALAEKHGLSLAAYARMVLLKHIHKVGKERNS